MNRVLASIERTKALLTKRLSIGAITEDDVTKLTSDLNMELDEYIKFQELKSLAVASDKLSLEEGMTIYNFLGESLETFNSQPVEVKSVLTSVFAELLKWSMSLKGASA